MKRQAFRALAAAAMTLSAAGCAITSMDARIAPNLELVDEDIGKGRVVGVTVIDERSTSDIGRRAIGGAKIKMTDDLAAIYQASLVRGLRQKGFDARSGAAARAARPAFPASPKLRDLSANAGGGFEIKSSGLMSSAPASCSSHFCE